MSILEKSTSGRIEKPVLMLIHGVEGVGKTTFATEAPNPYFATVESGTNEFDDPNLKRSPKINSYDEFNQLIDELILAKKNPKSEYYDRKTFAVDTIDALLPLINRAVAKKMGAKSVSDVGWGKGKEPYMFELRDLFSKLETLRDLGMHVIFISHSRPKSINDPLVGQYDKFILSMGDEEGSLWKQFVDTVLFLNRKVSILKGDRRGYGDGVIYMYTQERPAFSAKCRYGMKSEILMSKGNMWNAFITEKKAGKPNTPDVIRAEITGLLSNVTDENMRKRIPDVVKNAGDDLATLIGIRDQILELIGG